MSNQHLVDHLDEEVLSHKATDRQIIEEYTIQPIPLSERHGRTRDLFTIWFALQVGPVAIFTGALGPLLFELSFIWSLVAVVVGCALGTVLLALHSAQGPRLGVPQMIQSRGQFGSAGALLVVLLVVFIFIGYFATTLVTGGLAIQKALGGPSTDFWIVVGGGASVAIAAIGYDAIHRVGAWLTLFGGLAYVAIFIFILAKGLPSGFLTSGSGKFSSVLAMVGVAAVWMISTAPYVSDYSRYMPPSAASRRSTFWATYWGSMAGGLMPMILGIMIAVITGGEPTENLQGLVGAFSGGLLLVILGILTLHANSMNLYGGVLCLTTAVQTFRHDWLPGKVLRCAVIVTLSGVSVVIAIVFAENFLATYSEFLSILLYLLTPWSVINLIDYYLVRRGNYDIKSFFARGGGIYGWWNKPALLAYAIGIAVQVPFMSTTRYTGFLYDSLEVDISWIVCIVVTIPVYLGLVKLWPSREEPIAPLVAGDEASASTQDVRGL